MMRFNILIISIFLLLNDTYAQDKSASEHLDNYLMKRSELTHSSSKAFNEKEQTQLDGLYNNLKKDFPDSYQCHLVSYINSGYDNEFKGELMKANEKGSSNETVQKYMLAYYIINDNVAKQKEFVMKIDDLYSKNQWDYYRDLIITTNEGAIITSGQDDTFPLMAAKALYALNNDVEIVCLDFLQNDIYRKRIQSQLGMKDVPFLGKEKYFMAKLLKSANKKVIVSSTVNQNYLAQVETTIFLTGLGYEYNCEDQHKALSEFWVKVKQRNMESVSLSSWKERALYTNYIPPLLTLYRLKCLENTKDPSLRKTIMTLATKVKKEEGVEKILADYESNE